MQVINSNSSGITLELNQNTNTDNAQQLNENLMRLSVMYFGCPKIIFWFFKSSMKNITPKVLIRNSSLSLKYGSEDFGFCLQQKAAIQS